MAPVDSDGSTIAQAFEHVRIPRLLIALSVLVIQSFIYLPKARAANIYQSIVYLSVKTVHRIYFHPLSSYPGPKIAAATRLWYVYKILRGDLAKTIADLHRIHGPVLRVAPNELSFTSASAWQDIYGFRTGKPEMAKESPFYTNDAQPPSIITAKRERHSHFRRLMSRGFSDAALREQQPIIQSYVNLLMQRLREETSKGKSVDIVSWYNVGTSLDFT